MIESRIVIYVENENLLKISKSDLINDLQLQFESDDYGMEVLQERLSEHYDSHPKCDAIVEAFEEASVDELMPYITAEPNDVQYNEDETEMCHENGDTYLTAFTVQYQFDDEKFVADKVA